VTPRTRIDSATGKSTSATDTDFKDDTGQIHSDKNARHEKNRDKVRRVELKAF